MGAGASTLPASVLSRPLTKEHLNKDLLTCFNFEKLAGESGQVSIQQVISALQENTDLYFCQDWLGNIELSQQINDEMKNRGFHTSFTTDYKQDFAKQIDHTRLVLVFVTKSFLQKLNKSHPHSDGNHKNSEQLRHEFKYATLHKTSRRMIAIAMEDEMKDPKKWEGVLGVTFGSSVVLDFSDNKKSFESKIDDLIRLISEKIGSSIEDIVSTIDWKQVAQDLNYRPLDTSGASKVAIEEVNHWLVDNLQVTTTVAQAYSTIFVAAGVGSLSKLERKLKKHPDFLSQLTGLEAKDCEQIKAKLIPCIEGKFGASFAQKSHHKLLSKHNLLSPKNKVVATAAIASVSGKGIADDQLKHFLQNWQTMEEPALVEQLKQSVNWLTDNRAMCESIGEHEKGSSLKSVVKLLKHFQSKEDVLVKIFPLVNVLTRCGAEKTTTIVENIELLGRFGICDIVAEILEANQSKKKLIVLACTAIRNLTAAYVMSNQINFGYAGACETLTSLLVQNNNASESIVQMALCAIWNLCGTEDNQHKFATANIAEILKKLCRTHMAKPTILEPLFASIRILCYHHDENKIRFGTIGVCENIVIAYGTHIAHPMIAMHACGAIWNLANHPENRDRFSQTNICELVVKTLTTQLQVPSVVETACGAIWALATHSPQNRMKFNECGVCDAIILALKTHSKVVKIVELLCGALLVLIVQNNGLVIELMDSQLEDIFKPLQEVYKDHRDISHAITVVHTAMDSITT